MREPLWHPDGAGRAPSTHDRPPQVEMLLSGYLDESHARSLAVVPLSVAAKEDPSRPGETIGALVIERFYGGLDDGCAGTSSRLCVHSGLALRNAKEWEDLPLSGVLRKARWLSGNRRPLKIAAALAGPDSCLPPRFSSCPPNSASLHGASSSRSRCKMFSHGSTAWSPTSVCSTGSTWPPISSWPLCGGRNSTSNSSRCWANCKPPASGSRRLKPSASRPRAITTSSGDSTGCWPPRARNSAS